MRHVNIHREIGERGERVKTPLAFLSLGKESCFAGLCWGSPRWLNKASGLFIHGERVWVDKSLWSAETGTPWRSLEDSHLCLSCRWYSSESSMIHYDIEWWQEINGYHNLVARAKTTQYFHNIHYKYSHKWAIIYLTRNEMGPMFYLSGDMLNISAFLCYNFLKTVKQKNQSINNYFTK